jgi:phage shock protein E
MNKEKVSRRIASATVLALVLVTASCGGDDDGTAQPAVAETVAATNEETTTQPAAESILIDVRDVEEFASGHLLDAVNLPWNDGTLAAQIADLDPNASYRVYCRSGNRSGQAVALMLDAGFTNVVDLGGLEAAVASTGLELVTD